MLFQSLYANTFTHWSFETSASTNNINGSGSTLSGINPDGGYPGTASAFHSSAATTWSLASGNGSPNSWMADNWNKGDYFEFEASISSDFRSFYLGISFDLVGSLTAPNLFELEFSTDGTNFSQIGDRYYGISSSPTWNPIIESGAMNQFFENDDIAETGNLQTYYFRFVDQADTKGGAINGGDVTADGTLQIDNFTIYGTIPEPSGNTLAIFGGLFLLGFPALRKKDDRKKDSY